MVRPTVLLGLLGLAAASPLPPHNLVPESLQSKFVKNSTTNSTTVLSPLEMAMRANQALHHAPRSLDHTDPSTQAASERALVDDFAIEQADMPQSSGLWKRENPGSHCYDGLLVKVPFSMYPNRRGEKGYQVMTLEGAVRVQKGIRKNHPGWQFPELEEFTGSSCVPP